MTVQNYFFLFFLFFVTVSAAEDFEPNDYHREAIQRLISHHDAAMPIAIGSIVLKQAGLIRIRETLRQRGETKKLGSDWNEKNPEWLLAERQLANVLDRKIDNIVGDPKWFSKILYDLLVDRLTSEEADEIADHFETPTGEIQREIIDMSMIAETLQLAYTISRTIKPNIVGCESEYAHLQKIWWERKPEFTARANIYQDPAVRKFAGKATGRKYSRILAVQGIGAIMDYVRWATSEVELTVKDHSSIIDPFIASFLKNQI